MKRIQKHKNTEQIFRRRPIHRKSLSERLFPCDNFPVLHMLHERGISPTSLSGETRGLCLPKVVQPFIRRGGYSWDNLLKQAYSEGILDRNGFYKGGGETYPGELTPDDKLRELAEEEVEDWRCRDTITRKMTADEFSDYASEQHDTEQFHNDLEAQYGMDREFYNSLSGVDQNKVLEIMLKGGLDSPDEYKALSASIREFFTNSEGEPILNPDALMGEKADQS
ncbi:MAG: hypothetical protein PHX21_05880 [bacterium]|nr:hypothetical protein [bacterium]